VVTTHGEEGAEKEDACESTARDEEGFENVGADIRDVGDSLVRRHRCVFWLTLRKPDYYHCPQHT